MKKITIICPNKYAIGEGKVDFSILPPELAPVAFATLDGKPSEQYDPSKFYIASSLITTDPFKFDEVFQKITELHGKPLDKPANILKKRRINYLKNILQIFFKMKSDGYGFPFDTLIVRGFESALEPSEGLDLYRESPYLREKIFMSEISDRHVHFADGEWRETMTHEQFGGIYFWSSIVGVLDSYLTKKNGREIHWCLMADKLPCDIGGRRMTILFSMLDHMFGGRIILMFTSLSEGEPDIPADLLTDIFTSICYEAYSPDGSMDSDLNEALEQFNKSAMKIDRILF